MLEEVWNVTFTDAADDTTVINKSYEKDANEKFTADYVESTTIDNPELPCNNMELKKVEAKTSPQFYGTRRNYLKLRVDAVKPTPLGTSVLPALFKVETSIPVGFTGVEIDNLIREAINIISSQNFRDFVVRREI